MKGFQTIILIFVALFLMMCSSGGDKGKDTDAKLESDAAMDTAVVDMPKDSGKETDKDVFQGGEDSSVGQDMALDVPVDISVDIGMDIQKDALSETSKDMPNDLVSNVRVYGTISRTDPVKNLNPFGSDATDFTGTLYVGICEGNPITTEALTGDKIENADMSNPATVIEYSISGDIPAGHYWIGVYLDANNNDKVDSGDLIVETSPQIDLPETGAVKVDATINKMIP